jgi:apolipoprotein N-acyltransferase
LFPDFSVSLADLGAQFIVNVTNDSWYGTWQEPYQHMIMTLARAVEIRRPLVRVTNTGISTVVLASGEILQQSPMQEAWSGLYEVPYLKEPKATYYQQNFWGESINECGYSFIIHSMTARAIKTIKVERLVN